MVCRLLFDSTQTKQSGLINVPAPMFTIGLCLRLHDETRHWTLVICLRRIVVVRLLIVRFGPQLAAHLVSLKAPGRSHSAWLARVA